MKTEWVDATPTRRGEAWVRRGGEESAVYDPASGRLHRLNASALAIWELCDGSTTGREMAEAVAELAAMDLGAAMADVGLALDMLRREGLIDV